MRPQPRIGPAIDRRAERYAPDSDCCLEKVQAVALYLALTEAPSEAGGVKVLGVFSTLDKAKLRHEADGPKLPWMEMQGIGRRWWEVGVGGDRFIYSVELDEHL